MAFWDMVSSFFVGRCIRKTVLLVCIYFSLGPFFTSDGLLVDQNTALPRNCEWLGLLVGREITLPHIRSRSTYPVSIGRLAFVIFNSILFELDWGRYI